MLSPLWPWHHRLEVLSLAIQEDAPAHASSHCLSNSTPLLVLSSAAFSCGSLCHLVSALRNQKLGHKNSGKPDMEWGDLLCGAEQGLPGIQEGKSWRNPAGHGWEGRLSNFELTNSTLPHPNYSKSFLGQRHSPATGATFRSGLRNQLGTALSAVTCKGFAVIWVRGYKDVCQRTNNRSS